MRYIKFVVAILFILTTISCQEKDTSTIDIDRSDSGIILDIPLSGSLQNPAFSPDGNTVVFTRFLNGYNKEPAELFTYNLSTKKLSLLVSNGSANINLPGSSWNPLKKQIVFSSSKAEHDEIYLIGEKGVSGDEIQLTNRTDKMAYEPNFNPNGEWVVFESHKIDVEEHGIITKYRTDFSSDYIPLTDNESDCRQPNWSPSGDKILYQKINNGRWDIWVMNIDGTGKIKITSSGGDNTDAVFSNDGKFIYYSSDFELDVANIYKIPTGGGVPIRITNFKGYDGAPSISSDGTKLVFESINDDPDDSKGTRLVLLNL